MQSKTAYGFAALIFVVGSLIRVTLGDLLAFTQFEVLLIPLMPAVLLLTEGIAGVLSVPLLSAFYGYVISDMMYSAVTGAGGITLRELIVLSCFSVPSSIMCAGCSVTASLRLIGTVFLNRRIDLQPIAKNTVICAVSMVISFSVYFFGIK